MWLIDWIYFITLQIELKVSFLKNWWLWKEPFVCVVDTTSCWELLTCCCFRQLWQSSWARGQPGCLAGHHPERLSLQTGVCSAPRRFWWPTADDEGWFSSSCCLVQHCQPTPTPQQPDIPSLQPGTLVLQLQLVRRSCPCAEDDGYDPLETVVLHGSIGSSPFPWLCLPFLVQTWW